jgi:hypothetical protein
MPFTAYTLQCLAFRPSVIGAAPDTIEAQVDVGTANSDQGQTVQEETTKSTPV